MRELTPDDFTTTPLDFLTAVRGPFAFPLPASAGEGPPAGGLLTFAGGQIGIFDPSIEWGIDVLNIWNARSDALTAVKDIFSAFGHWVWGFIGGVGRFVFNGIGDAIVWLSGVTARVGGDVVGWISSAGQWVWDHVRGGLGDLTSWVSSSATWVWDHVRGGFGDVTSWVSSSATWVWDHVRGGFGDLASWVTGAAQWTWGKVEPAIAGAADAIAGGLLSGFQWLFDALFGNIADTFGEAGSFYDKLLTGGFGGGVAGAGGMLSFYSGHRGGILQTMISIIGLAGALVKVAVDAGSVTAEDAVQSMKALFPNTLPSVGVLQEALRRRDITDGEVDDVLSRQGYNSQRRQLLKDLRYALPGPGDVVQMASRFAFDPSAAAAVGFTGAPPGGMSDALSKLGYRDDAIGAYWTAHWALPSIAQATEMFHRDIINEATLRAHLAASGFPSLWRDAYIRDVYNPFSRIDLRRMYKIGVLTEAELLDGYRKLGYDDYHARALVEFTKRYYAPEDVSEQDDRRKEMGAVIRQAYRRRLVDHASAVQHMVSAGYVADDAAALLAVDDLYLQLNPGAEQDPDLKNVTVAMITTSYGDGVMARADAQRFLEIMGFTPAGADIALSIVDHRAAAELTNLAVEVIHQEYLSNALDDAAAGQQLVALELDTAHVELTVRKWQLEKSKKTARLSLAQVVAAYHAGKLDGSAVLVELATLGYSARDIDILLTLGTADLTLAEITKARKKGVFTDAETRSRLLAKGYTAGDTDVLLAVA